MSNQKADHSTLDDITNNTVQPPVDEAERKREEKNRKQQEYRARIKANETDEQREERNKRRREQRVLKRTESSTHTIGPDHGQRAPYGVCSGILQASDAEDKENVCPENNTDWLHKNYNYVRTRQPTSHTSCVPNDLTSHNLFNATATPVTSSNRQRALAKRERYNNMNEHDKENMLQRKRDYKKKMRTQSAGDLAKETLHTVQNDIEYDGALFEPITNQSDEEDHLEAPRALDIDDLLDDEETRQYIGEDGAFESNRVSVNGVDLNNNEDPYDYVYQNFPDRHHVLRKVPNCLYCGARRFQYESPGFCCRKGVRSCYDEGCVQANNKNIGQTKQGIRSNRKVHQEYSV